MKYKVIKKCNSYCENVYCLYIKKWYGWKEYARLRSEMDLDIVLNQFKGIYVYEDSNIRAKGFVKKGRYGCNDSVYYKIQKRRKGLWLNTDFEGFSKDEAVVVAKDVIKEEKLVRSGYINLKL